MDDQPIILNIYSLHIMILFVSHFALIQQIFSNHQSYPYQLFSMLCMLLIYFRALNTLLQMILQIS